jgi:hypothetical protein
MIIWAVAWGFRTPLLYLWRFFTGFCLVANGVYVGFGPNSSGLDTETMLRHGSTRGIMLAFGIPAVLLGLRLWHGSGQHFGLGDPDGRVDTRAVVVSIALLAAVISIELLVAR